MVKDRVNYQAKFQFSVISNLIKNTIFGKGTEKMSKQKKLTLQEYIQSQNTRRKLSKQKLRSNSASRPMFEAIKNLSQNPKIKTYLGFSQEATEAMCFQIDQTLKKLQLSLWELVGRIKNDCRDFIRNDKDFVHFTKLMDLLMHKYKEGISQIQKQSLSILRMANEKDQQRRVDLLKSQKGRYTDKNQPYYKSETETSETTINPQTIKDQMTEQRKGEQFIRSILQGSKQPVSNQKQLPYFNKYSSQNNNQPQKNKPGLNFLNFIVKKVEEVNKLKLNQNIQLSISGDSLILSNQFNQLNISSSFSGKNNQNCSTNQGSKRLSIEASKLVESIYILSSNEKVNMEIQTEDIDNFYEAHNFSFGFKSSQIGKFSSLKQSMESPRFPHLRTSPSAPEYLTPIQQIDPRVKIERVRSPPLPSHQRTQTKNEIQHNHPFSRSNHIIQRANQRSKNKQIKLSAQKKAK